MAEKSMDIVLVVPRQVYNDKMIDSRLAGHRLIARGVGITIGAAKVIPSAAGTREVRLSNLKGVTWEDIQFLSMKYNVRIMGDYAITGLDGEMRETPAGHWSNAPAGAPRPRCTARTEDGTQCERLVWDKVGGYGYCRQHLEIMNDPARRNRLSRLRLRRP